MSALTDRIAAEHGGWFNLDGVWRCNCGEPLPPSANADMWMRAHIAAVTEAAVREQGAAELYAVAEKWAERANDMLLRAKAYSHATTRSLAYAHAASIASGALVKDLPEEAQS